MAERFDVAVVGAGFGGLGAALELARSGARVVVCEALNYAGGCASTFRRGGRTYEAGATLFSGLLPSQLFGRWAREERLPIVLEPLDPVVELRAPGLTLPVWADRARFVEALAALPAAPAQGVRAFFAAQHRAADALWPLFDDADRLEVVRGLPFHLGRLPGYAPLLRWVGRPLSRVLEAFGVADFAPLRLWADAVCQITVQCSAAEAEAPFALAALDYFWRGTFHLRGGIGSLSTALADAISARGGQVRFANRVGAMARTGEGGWRLETRRGAVEARAVIANVLPPALSGLVRGVALSGLERRTRALEDGWGAAMLYLAVDAPPGASAHHFELVRDPSRPLVEGNHVFASVGGAHDRQAADGLRSVTVSTHVPLRTLREHPERGRYVAEIQTRMEQTILNVGPAWLAAPVHRMTGSPRTFERFTRRPEGAVGGVPRRAGLAQYRGLLDGPVAPGLWLVGDSVFPGQSALATAVGGVRAARQLLRSGALASR